MAYKSLFIFFILHVALAWNADSEDKNGNALSRLYRTAGGVNDIRNSPLPMKKYGSRPLVSKNENPLRWRNYYGSPNSYVFTESENKPTNSYEKLIATILEHITAPVGMTSGYNSLPMQNMYTIPGQEHLYSTPLTGTTHTLAGVGQVYNPSDHYLPPSTTYDSGIPGSIHQPSGLPQQYNTPGYGHAYQPSIQPTMHNPVTLGQTYLPQASSPYQTTGFGQPLYSPQLGAYHGSLQTPHSVMQPSPLNPYDSLTGSPQDYSSYNYPPAPLVPATEASYPLTVYNPSTQLPATNGNGFAYAQAGAWDHVISQPFINDLYIPQASAMAGATANQFPSNVNNFQNSGLMSKQMGPTPTYAETGTDHPCAQPVTPGPTSQDMKQMGNLMRLVRVLLRDHRRGNKEDTDSDNQLSKEEGCNFRSAAIESGDEGTSEEVAEVRKKPTRKAAPFLRDR